MRYAVDEDAAKDILQETYIKIFKHYDPANFEAEALMLAWMKRVCINEALGYLRKKKNWDKLQIAFHSQTYNQSYEFENKELYTILLELPAKQRLCFSLFAIDGYSHKEISQQLDVSESHSRTLLTRARQQLAKKLTKTKAYEIL